MRIELLAPGLLGPVTGRGSGSRSDAIAALIEGLSLPALDRSIAIARLERADEQNNRYRFANDYFSLYGLNGARASDLDAVRTRGLAALCREFECGDAEDAHWMRADPVHLVADLQTVRMAEFENWHLDEADTAQLLELINDYAREWGVVFEPSPSGALYLRAEDAWQVQNVAPLSALGQDIRQFLPRADEARVWVSRMNELQMLLHDCALNERRAERRLQSINGLWFWGAGRREDAAVDVLESESDSQRPFVVLSNDPLGSGLGVAHGAQQSPLADDANQLLQQLRTQLEVADSNARVIVVVRDLLRPALTMDLEVWRSNLQRFEANWLSPLLAAYDNKTITALDLFAESRTVLHLPSGNRASTNWRQLFMRTASRVLAPIRGSGGGARGLAGLVGRITNEVQT